MQPGEQKYWRSSGTSPLIEASLFWDEDAVIYGSVKSTNENGDMTVLMSFEVPVDNDFTEEMLRPHTDALNEYTQGLEIITE